MALGDVQITIITPCLNGADFVRGAIDSVLRQDNGINIEHIVLDAGSTDDTRNILSEYSSLRIVAEPDKGSHDAMNKGLRMARGGIIGFLNTDDFYQDGAFAAAVREFSREPELDMLCLSHEVCSEDGATLDQGSLKMDGLRLEELSMGVPAFNSRFFRRRLFVDVGEFNITYDFAADREFLIRCALSGVISKTLPLKGYTYCKHKGSRTLSPCRSALEAMINEHARMASYFSGLSGISLKERQIFNSWKIMEALRMVKCLLCQQRGTDACKAMLGSLREDPEWIRSLLRGMCIRWGITE